MTTKKQQTEQRKKKTHNEFLTRPRAQILWQKAALQLFYVLLFLFVVVVWQFIVGSLSVNGCSVVYCLLLFLFVVCCCFVLFLLCCLLFVYCLLLFLVVYFGQCIVYCLLFVYCLFCLWFVVGRNDSHNNNGHHC